MKRKSVKVVAYGLTLALTLSTFGMQASAAGLSEILPAAGIGLTLSEGTSLQSIKENITKNTDKKGMTLSVADLNAILNNGSASVRTSVTAHSMVKDSAIAIAAKAEESKAADETLMAESASVTNAKMGAETLSIINVLQNSVLTSAASSLGDLTLTAVPAVASIAEDAETETETSAETETAETEETSESSVEQAVASAKAIETTQTAEDIAREQVAQALSEDASFSKLVIAKVNSYVNVRSMPSEDGEVVGKLYDKSVGTFVTETDGWYEITSGHVTGYVKAEYCVTGADAITLAKEVGTRIATVTTTTLKVRQDPNTDSTVLGLVPNGEELTVSEEQDGWVKVNIEEGDGWVSADYVTLRTDFVEAESKAEEEARLAKEAAARAAAKAAAKASTKSSSSSSGKNYNSASSYVAAGGGSASGNAVVNYALQFVGNPYVYGGTSLTNGADCSGFVMSVYKNFGVSLPHSSSADRSVGSTVGSLSEAQPGDLICYSGHVGIYVGGGKLVHASTKKTGIIVSDVSYRRILAIRRIF